MRPDKLPIEPFTSGDAWAGIPTVIITIGPDGGPYATPASPLTLATMRFSKIGSESATVVELSTAGAAQITIVSAANWELSIPVQIIPGLTAGKWAWQLRCHDSSATGNPQTYLSDTLEILETI